MRVRIELAYDGTEFAGWARQPGQRTVQDELENALARVMRLPHPPSLTVAGRTDAGVHASGQVAHGEFAQLPPLRWLNAQLPADVQVRALSPAPEGFDARFSALSRSYRYRISDTGFVSPLRRHDTLAWRRSLDPEAMNVAAASLVGEHDFAAFCKHRAGATTVRQLLAFQWQRDAAGVLEALVSADAFCHSMVRALVGALLPVGEGRKDPGWPARVLAAGVRDPGVLVVRPHGLCLEHVAYPPDEQLQARAQQTRRPRQPSDRGCGQIR